MTWRACDIFHNFNHCTSSNSFLKKFARWRNSKGYKLLSPRVRVGIQIRGVDCARWCIWTWKRVRNWNRTSSFKRQVWWLDNHVTFFTISTFILHRIALWKTPSDEGIRRISSFLGREYASIFKFEASIVLDGVSECENASGTVTGHLNLNAKTSMRHFSQFQPLYFIEYLGHRD